MKFRQSILSLIALSLASMLAGCGGGSSHTPPPQAISVALSPAPPTSLQTNAAQPLTAVVSNDPSSSPQVTWTVTCGSSGACGSFSPTTSASAAATTYTAPSAVPTGNTVSVTATSVTDTTKSASATITITAPAASPLADGTYIFSVTGEDQFGNSATTCAGVASTECSPYFVAGAFVVSSGAITGGEQDLNDLGLIVSDPITGGSVTTTADGNLQITLTTADLSIGVGGVETFNGTLVSPSRALITEFDASATSSGSLDVQASTVSAPSGGYAFVTAGLDGSGSPVDIGGVINVDGTGAISGTGSVFDIDDNLTVSQGQTFAASTVSAPDSFGRVTFTLNPSVASGISPFNLVGYIVGPEHIRLVETTDTLNATTGGEALGQGANTGTFSAASLTSFVFGTSGADANGAFQVAGVVTATSGTTVSGTLNFNDLTGTVTQPPITVSGTYSVDTTGRVTLTNLTDGATINATAQLYLSGFGTGTVAGMDTVDVLAGLAYEQTGGPFTASSFSGSYAMSATGFDFNNELEFDAVGPVSADGVGTLTGAGTIDQNFLTPPAAPLPGLTVSGAFTANSSGVFTGTITGLDIDTATNGDAFTYYIVDTTRVLAIETDANQLSIVSFELQP
jgi:hypothetical protein